MKTQAAILMGALALGMFFIPAASAGDFTCQQLVDYGMLSISSISHGTLFLPEGAVQIDGGLFYSSEKAETGVFYGEAYNLTRHPTGLFVGGGY